MPLFIRWGDLTDKLVGKTARGKRPFIRWPEALVDLKKACAGIGVGKALIATGLALIGIPMILEMMFGSYFSFVAAGALAWIAGGVGLTLGALTVGLNLEEKRTERVEKASETMKPLLGKDPYLDLQLAAFLTVGAMPVWLKGWTWPGRWPGPSRPYTVERAGVDYLELMRRIEQDPKKYMWSFHGKGFPGVDYRLTGSLKDAVVEIILLLSSLPDSGEEPDEETEAAVLYTINRLATIDGESFTAAVRRLHAEEEDKARAEKKAAEDKKKADYSSEIRRALYAANSALDAKADAETDEKYKSIQRGVKRLSKISEESGCAAESAAVSIGAECCGLR